MPKPNPFTPKSGWGPKIFAGRKDEFEFLDKKLEEARNGAQRVSAAVSMEVLKYCRGTGII